MNLKQHISERFGTDYYFRHFSFRLKERYDIEITEVEYNELCKRKIKLLYIISPNKRFGVLNIKGVDVWVIKCNASKLLNTALFKSGHLPVPLRYKRRCVYSAMFRADLKLAIKQVCILKQLYINSGITQKDFFVNRPFNFPNWMYGAAYSLTQKRKDSHIINHTTVRLVKNIYNT